ncbi:MULTISPECIES: hypothetical protein [Parachlamydia]|jgi:hypothetical protein|uniref:hypothetical protein n=1 Tax=Parachlamydia TaxID=83551 RepID=UPI0001C17322|nr:hypothetical protein [Parachlamydia acanthamoebae]EFB40111.1 hypothetical protein pah_c260o008 [Parachlamydia acanthamoebae str. Hall's coccus]
MKKQHKHLSSPFETSETASSSSQFDWDSVMHWLETNGKILLGVAAILFFLLILFFRFIFDDGKNAEADYFQAASAFHIFETAHPGTNPKVELEALDTLKGLLTKRPELHAAYDGVIAQTLINRGLIQDAQPFAESALSRTKKDELPFYTIFAQTTLAICDKKYEQALNATQTLAKQMEEQTDHFSFGETLNAFNLLRLAMLNQQLGAPQEERKVWESWDSFRKKSPVVYEKIAREFESEKILLTNYVESREKILKK